MANSEAELVSRNGTTKSPYAVKEPNYLVHHQQLAVGVVACNSTRHILGCWYHSAPTTMFGTIKC